MLINACHTCSTSNPSTEHTVCTFTKAAMWLSFQGLAATEPADSRCCTLELEQARLRVLCQGQKRYRTLMFWTMAPAMMGRVRLLVAQQPTPAL